MRDCLAVVDLIPAAFYGGVLAFVLGIWASASGLPLSDTAKYTRRTTRIVYLLVALVGAAAAGVAWRLGR